MNWHHDENTNMSKHSIPFSPELINGEEEERNKVTERADRIVQRLFESRRDLLSRRFDSPYLIFSDGGIVCLSYGVGEAQRDVESLLSEGAGLLGIITAPKKDGLPVIQVWQQENAEARAELRSMAKSLYWRRFRTTEAQERILPKCSRSLLTGA